MDSIARIAIIVLEASIGCAASFVCIASIVCMAQQFIQLKPRSRVIEFPPLILLRYLVSLIRECSSLKNKNAILLCFFLNFNQENSDLE